MKSDIPFRIVAIDGPAGAGKSTVAKEVARRLGYLYLDTGALYRAVALSFLRQKVDTKDDRSLKSALSKPELRLDPKGKVFLNGEDVSAQIRTPEVSAEVSRIAAIATVREKMVGLQQAIGRGEGIVPKPPGLVAEGRDIGTVVFPKAQFKFFLTADLKTRAVRRQKEFVSGGHEMPVEAVMKEIAKRDKQDSEREISPLKKADDAVEVDTSGMNIEQATEFVLRKIQSA